VQAKAYTSEPISVEASPLAEQFNRADIEFHGLDHSEESFQGRVFLNNPDADENTELTPDQGYAGSFSVFGHGGCFGDVGHCEVPTEQRAHDPRQSHPLIPQTKVVRATEALRRAAAQGEGFKVTVVPVLPNGIERPDTEGIEDVLKFDHISIISYR
jgi:hypothetical protein